MSDERCPTCGQAIQACRVRDLLAFKPRKGEFSPTLDCPVEDATLVIKNVGPVLSMSYSTNFGANIVTLSPTREP